MILNGTFFDSENVKKSKYTPIKLDRDIGNMFQVKLTYYTINTFFEACASTG